MTCSILVCDGCGNAIPGCRPRTCPICGARMIIEFDERGDHDNRYREEDRDVTEEN